MQIQKNDAYEQTNISQQNTSTQQSTVNAGVKAVASQTTITATTDDTQPSTIVSLDGGKTDPPITYGVGDGVGKPPP
jgi:hypothetical protein